MNHFHQSIGFVNVLKKGGVSPFEQLLAALDGTMTTPSLYGWFHLLCLTCVIGLCALVFWKANGIKDKQFNLIIGFTAALLLLLETYKQFNYTYDVSTDTWEFEWYAFPFQFCSTPMYVMLLGSLLKNGKVKDSLCAFLATYGLFAGAAVMFYPGDVFIETIGINVQTMIHHGAMVVIGVFMYVSGRAKLSSKTILKGLPVFLCLLTLAMTGNELYHRFGDPEQTFNMFFISPYYACTLPILSEIYKSAPYIVFLLCYIVGFTVAGHLISLLAIGARSFYQKARERSFSSKAVPASGVSKQNPFILQSQNNVENTVNAYMPASNGEKYEEKQMKNIAIVTGASSGIGKEFFLSLNDKKDSLDEIWVIARSEGKLEELRSLTDIPVRVFPLDLSSPEATGKIDEALKAESPAIQYLICASGFGRFNAIADDNADVLENMVDLNCRSIVGVTRVAFPYMAKGGSVLLIASMAALQPIPYIATYAATKAFVLSYGRALNKELRAARGARCMCVCPFWTKTAFFDRAFAEKTIVKKYSVMYKPEQIVKQAWKDLKKKKRDVSIFGFTAKGQALLVKLFPHRFVMWVWMNQQGLK